MNKKATSDTVNTRDITLLERQALARQVEREKREIERLIAQAWPDPDTLAMLAAQTRFAKLPEADAVRDALKLRQAARDAIEVARKSSHQQFKKTHTCPTPEHWPAKLADFYKLVVRGKDKAENQPRFKRFLKFRAEGKDLELADGSSISKGKFVFTLKSGTDEQPPTQSAKAVEKAVERQLAEYQTAQFNQETWIDLARDYFRWWAWESQEGKRRGGKARAAKAAEKSKRRRKNHLTGNKPILLP